jgi:hypothetical protein
MRYLKLAAVAATSLVALASATSASAVVIDFEDLDFGVQPAGPVVYPEATFTSSSGLLYVGGAGIGKDLCTYTGSCDADLTVDFSSPVSNLSFQAAGDDAASTIFYTVFFGGGGSVGGTFALNGTFSTLKTYSFGALSDIVKIEFSDDDGAGIVYDNFTFDVGAGAVPEPASWAMMIGGMAMVGAAMRRRRTQVSFA